LEVLILRKAIAGNGPWKGDLAGLWRGMEEEVRVCLRDLV